MRLRIRAYDIVGTAILIVASILAIFPVFWMVSSSVKLDILVWSLPPVWLFEPTLENYVTIFLKRNFGKWLVNSIIVSTGSTTLSILLGSLAAYALTRFRIKGGDDIAFWMLSLRMMPPIVVVLPIYIFFSQLRLMDTHLALILAHTTINLPFSVWMLRGFFTEIPRDFDEAALIDGCSTLGVLFRIILPIAAPGLAATALFCIIQSWNDFIFAFSLTSINATTLPVPISGFLGDYVWEWTAFYAGGTVCAVPVILLSLLVQKYLVRGMTLGAIRR